MYQVSKHPSDFGAAFSMFEMPSFFYFAKHACIEKAFRCTTSDKICSSYICEGTWAAVYCSRFTNSLVIFMPTPRGFHHSPETRRKMRESHLGEKFTEERKKKISESHLGAKNPNWKGNELGYYGFHARIKNTKTRQARCERCGVVNGKLDLSFEDHTAGERSPEKYNLDPNSYHWFCRRCHMILDGRLQKFNKLARVV